MHCKYTARWRRNTNHNHAEEDVDVLVANTQRNAGSVEETSLLCRPRGYRSEPWRGRHGRRAATKPEDGSATYTFRPEMRFNSTMMMAITSKT
jgi:hypothetical protein